MKKWKRSMISGGIGVAAMAVAVVPVAMWSKDEEAGIRVSVSEEVKSEEKQNKEQMFETFMGYIGQNIQVIVETANWAEAAVPIPEPVPTPKPTPKAKPTPTPIPEPTPITEQAAVSEQQLDSTPQSVVVAPMYEEPVQEEQESVTFAPIHRTEDGNFTTTDIP